MEQPWLDVPNVYQEHSLLKWERRRVLSARRELHETMGLVILPDVSSAREIRFLLIRDRRRAKNVERAFIPTDWERRNLVTALAMPERSDLQEDRAFHGRLSSR